MSLVIKIFTVLSLAFCFSAVHADEKEWTILVFLNADNNLESYGYMDVQEMEKVGSTDSVNVVVQFDPIASPGTKRFLVEKSTTPYSRPNEFHSRVVEEMPEQDMGDYQTLVDFAVWGMRTYPAKKYAIVFWNHGSGWSKEGDALMSKSISYDDTSGNHISTNQISLALSDVASITANRMGLVAFDACLMAMYEIADSIAEYSDYLVASEANVPGRGFAYDELLQQFNAREERTPHQLALDMVETYQREYENTSSASKGVTIGAMELNKLAEVKDSLSAWVQEIQKSEDLSRDDLLDIAKGTVAYQNSDYRDLGDYLSGIETKMSEKQSDEAELMEATRSIRSKIDSIVISHWASGRYAKSTGLAIHLPYRTRGYSPWSALHILSNKKRRDAYMALDWASTTTWPSHLDQLFPSQ